MTTHLQEFFSSTENDSWLVQLLTESGFTKVPDWKSGFQADNTFLDVQRIDSPNHIAQKSGHQYGFVL
ncbi:MAG TPA: hypothetical protein VJI32_00970 [Candidatus Nanoarchaeia archaeon]|nr:hypothetical protein [Candidatus Nanoarchaeia archaeon]